MDVGNVGEIIELRDVYDLRFDVYMKPKELLEISGVDIDNNGKKYYVIYEIDEIDDNEILNSTIRITAITLI